MSRPARSIRLACSAALVAAVLAPLAVEGCVSTEAPPPAADEPNIGRVPGCKRCTLKVIRTVYAFASSVTVQTLMYFAFVYIVQMLVRSVRSTDEYYLDKQFSDTLM